MNKPRIDQGPDYERGFVDGMQYQMQSRVDKAINRMAQPEQEPVQCWKCGDMDAEFQAKCDVPACGMKETKQKPVANYCKECLTYNGHQEGCSQYTTPPQRTWVGLTDEEIKYIEEDFSNEFGLEAKHSVDFAQAIEAKLKEKNT